MSEVNGRVAVVSMHTSPLAQPGQGDSGGMNVYVRELSGSLARTGLDVVIYVRRSDPTQPTVVDVEPGLSVKYLDAGPYGLAKEDLPGVIPEFTAAMAADLREQPPMAIHGHYWLSGEVGHVLKHEFEVPLITTFHTLGEVKRLGGDPEPSARIDAERRIVGCSDLILANAREEQNQLVDLYGAETERVIIVSPGVDRAVFSPGGRAGARAALGLDDGPRLLFVGRIQPLKGLDVAVRTLAASNAPGVRLSIVGGPSGDEGQRYLDDVRRLVDDLGVGDRIDWRPPQPHHRLSTWYRAADVVLMPSRSESFGLVALEAAACGTPVVATAVGGLRSLVRHGESGLLVEGRDPADHAAAADRILGSTSTAARLSAGAARVADEHTWSHAARGLEQSIARLQYRAPVSCA